MSYDATPDGGAPPGPEGSEPAAPTANLRAVSRFGSGLTLLRGGVVSMSHWPWAGRDVVGVEHLRRVDVDDVQAIRAGDARQPGDEIGRGRARDERGGEGARRDGDRHAVAQQAEARGQGRGVDRLLEGDLDRR